MNRLEEFKKRLKFVKWKELISVFPMFGAMLCSLVFRLWHRNMWLVCERRNEARDNGYWFFKYMREQHPEVECVYAIDPKARDFSKVKVIGNTIPFGGFKHWLYYFTARKNISSQKGGKPNATLCFALEVYLGMVRNRVYLKHGIIKDDMKWVYYDVTKMSLFICAAYGEYNMIVEKFGYPSGSVQLTGLCRFDNLLTPHEVKRQILVMPTQREWLRVISSDTLKYEGTYIFEESEYFKTWTHLLASSKLTAVLEKYDIQLLFYPHAAMQQYVHLFESSSSRIKVADRNNYDVQQLLMESSVLVTDYSSVFMDFAYMQKPVVYYHFDYEKYRQGQYQEGYFSYTDNGFGRVVKNEDALLEELEVIASHNFIMEQKYKERTNNFFAYQDTHNCERVYQAILNMK